MRIALSGAFWGLDTTGSGQYIMHLLPALARLSLSEEYRLFLPCTRAGAADVPGSPTVTMTLSTPFDKLSGNLAKVWFEQCAFPHAVRREACDLAHVPYFAPPLRPTIPTVVTIHDLIPLILPEYRGSRLVQGYMRLVSCAARRAALVLTDSHAAARDIVCLLDIPEGRIRVTYLAADAIYHPLTPSERAAVSARLHLPERYLLYLGGFDQRKNVIGLLRAYAAARARLGAVSLVVAGQLPQVHSDFFPDPRRMAQDSGITEAVHFTGWVAEEDKPALYGGALAFLFPSYYEGFGLPALEAISCGTPAIVGSGSSLEEIVGPGGLVVRPADLDALAEGMVRLVNDAVWRADLAARGLAHARRFTWAATAQATLAAYRSVLDHSAV